MKLRYYLRGIGIGILVSATIFISSGMAGRKNVMTDAQIKARALELGMVEDKAVLSDIVAEVTPEPTEAVTEEEAAADSVEAEDVIIAEETAEEVAESESEKEAVENEAVSDGEEEEASEPVEESVVEEIEKPDSTGEKIAIVINKGNGSDTVARKLYEAGLVADATAYDKWLIQNGYDRKISAGTFEIEKGASEEQIALIISGRGM